MDKEYRRALKKHLMKAFETNKTDFIEKQKKTTSPDLVQALFSTPSVISRSRIIDALIDTPMQSSRESYDNNYDNKMYCQCSPRISQTKEIPSSLNQSKMCPPTTARSKRMKGGDNTNLGFGDCPNKSQTNLSIYTFGSTNYSSRSRTSSFRRRTARELSNMVLAECKLVESLNLVETARSEQQEKEDLDLPIVLWRSKKKKFNSSIDLRFDCLSMETSRSKNKNKELLASERSSKSAASDGHGSTTDGDELLDAEGIIRKQFTGPLIRHVERNYVRNITATADLLKILERMPADIDRALAKECSK